MNSIIANYKKNRITVKRAYPWSFTVSRIVNGVFNVLFPMFIFTFVFNKELDSSFINITGTSDYITYIILGAAINVLAVSVLMNVGRSIILEIREGTFESILVTPSCRINYYIGCFLEQATRSILEFIIILILGIMLGANINIDVVFKFLFVLIITLFSFFSMSIILSTIMVYTRDTYITQSTIFILMDTICGVLFPIEYLPKVIQFISNMIPFTKSLELVRNIVLKNESLFSNLNLIITLILLSSIYFFIGIALTNKIDKKVIEDVLS